MVERRQLLNIRWITRSDGLDGLVKKSNKDGSNIEVWAEARSEETITKRVKPLAADLGAVVVAKDDRGTYMVLKVVPSRRPTLARGARIAWVHDTDFKMDYRVGTFLSWRGDEAVVEYQGKKLSIEGKDIRV